MLKLPSLVLTKLANVDSYLSPEMKSTGEVMGTDTTYAKALHKALLEHTFKSLTMAKFSYD